MEKIRGTKIDFPTVLNGVNSYDEIQNALTSLMKEMKTTGIQRIGFVSGAVATSPEVVESNLKLLLNRTEELHKQHQFPIFSSADIFFDGFWDKLPESNLSKDERSPKLQALFRGILEGGVTDIFMMPKWEFSGGARDEHETAQKLGITIHYLEPNVDGENKDRE